MELSIISGGEQLASGAEMRGNCSVRLDKPLSMRADLKRRIRLSRFG